MTTKMEYYPFCYTCTCGRKTAVREVGLGNNLALIIKYFCLNCRQHYYAGYSLEAVAVMHATLFGSGQKCLPPVPVGQFTTEDLEFLHEMRIEDDK